MNRRSLIWIGPLVAILPFIASGLAEWFAHTHGCVTSLGAGSIPCIINGKDYGEIIHYWDSFALYIILSLPLGLALTSFGVGKTPLFGAKTQATIQNATPVQHPKKLIWIGILLIAIPQLLLWLEPTFVQMFGQSGNEAAMSTTLAAGGVLKFTSYFLGIIGFGILYKGIIAYRK